MPSLKEILAAKKKAEPDRPKAGVRMTRPGQQPEKKWQQVPLVPQEPEPRHLCRTQGEDVPMEYPSATSSPQENAWIEAMHSLDTELGIWIEPESGNGWLAVQRSGGSLPLLLTRLPLINSRRAQDPF